MMNRKICALVAITLDVHRERLLGRTGGVHLCSAGDPRVVDPTRSIGNYRLKGELPTGYVTGS